MADEKLYGRADLVAIAGVPDDAVAFWLRNDLLISYVSGDRKHRRFAERELKFAMVLGELRNYGMNVRAMAQIVERLRDALGYYDLHPRPRHFLDAIGALQSGATSEQEAREQLQSIVGITAEELSDAVAYSQKVNPRKVDDIWLAVVFQDGEVLTAERESAGTFSLRAGAPGDDGPSTSSCLVLNLGRIFARARS